MGERGIVSSVECGLDSCLEVPAVSRECLNTLNIPLNPCNLLGNSVCVCNVTISGFCKFKNTLSKMGEHHTALQSWLPQSCILTFAVSESNSVGNLVVCYHC